jgi:hypothetical protein
MLLGWLGDARDGEPKKLSDVSDAVASMLNDCLRLAKIFE